MAAGAVTTEVRFRAMGTDVHVVIVGARPGMPEMTRRFLEDLEGRWSRFRSTSEISMLNALAGLPVRVSTETLVLVELALEGADRTAGRYDPTVLGAVLRAGYDRSFEHLPPVPASNGSTLEQGYERIAVDHAASTVTVPAGVGFDPGGIGKGYAADLLVEELLALGAAGACANLGGDLRVQGEPPSGGPWAVAVEHPLAGSPVALVGLREGAVATTSQAKRAWGSPDDRRHHLIDPATGRPADGGVLSATVVASEAWLAEVLAKAAFLSGVRGGLELFDATGTDGLLFDDQGSMHRSAGFERFTQVEPLVASGASR